MVEIKVAGDAIRHKGTRRDLRSTKRAGTSLCAVPMIALALATGLHLFRSGSGIAESYSSQDAIARQTSDLAEAVPATNVQSDVPVEANVHFDVPAKDVQADVPVEAENAEETAPPPTTGSPRCEMRIAGDCKEFPHMKVMGDWFLDSDKGGPDATTPEECQARKKGWEDSCESEVEMRFSGAGEDNTANAEFAVCMLRISKECTTGEEPPPYGVWFHDKDHGGPPATEADCKARQESWKITCPDGGVDMAYDADWPKVPPLPEGSPRCEFQIAGRDKERIASRSCKKFPNFPAGWFLDSDKGGPEATTPEECQARKKSWEESCETAAEMRFIGAAGEIVAVNTMGGLSRGVVERYLDNPARVSPNRQATET